MKKEYYKKEIIENIIIFFWVCFCGLVGLTMIAYADNIEIENADIYIIGAVKSVSIISNRPEESNIQVAISPEQIPEPTRAPLIKPEPNEGAEPDHYVYDIIIADIGTTVNSLGEFNVKSYDPYLESDGLTYSGEYAQYNRTVAIDDLAFGTELLIGGRIYTVMDRPEIPGEVNICQKNLNIDQSMKVYIIISKPN